MMNLDIDAPVPAKVRSDPSGRFRINYLKSEKPFVLARFITECGHKLDAKVLTVAAAIQYFHGFRKACGVGVGDVSQPYDPYLIATACLYLAGKVEDNDYLQMRDVINVTQTTLHRGREPPSLDGDYYSTREAIVQAELFVLRMLGFRTAVRHPHKYLLHYLHTLSKWFGGSCRGDGEGDGGDDGSDAAASPGWDEVPVARTSWALMQDAYHDPDLVEEAIPEELSLACIHVALQTYGVQVPLFPEVEAKDGTAWFKVLCSNASRDRIWQIATRLMDIHAQEAVHLAHMVEAI